MDRVWRKEKDRIWYAFDEKFERLKEHYRTVIDRKLPQACHDNLSPSFHDRPCILIRFPGYGSVDRGSDKSVFPERGAGKFPGGLPGIFKFSEKKRGMSPFRGSQGNFSPFTRAPPYRIFPLCQTLIESLTLTQHEDRSHQTVEYVCIYIYIYIARRISV